MKNLSLSLRFSTASFLSPILFILFILRYFITGPYNTGLEIYRIALFFFVIASPFCGLIGIILGKKQNDRDSVKLGMIGATISVVILLLMVTGFYKNRIFSPPSKLDSFYGV